MLSGGTQETRVGMSIDDLFGVDDGSNQNESGEDSEDGRMGEVSD